MSYPTIATANIALTCIALVGAPMVICENAVVAQILVSKTTASSNVDGAVTPDEYGSGRVLATPFEFYINAYRGGAPTFEEEIQLFIQVPDGSSNIADQFHILFDVRHRHSEPLGDADRRIVIDRSNATAQITRHNGTGPPVDITCNDGSLGERCRIGTSAGEWRAEVRITASQLDLSVLPYVLGVFIRVIDGPGTPPFGAAEHDYPATASAADITGWEDVRLRNPIDFAVMLDYSESMANLDGLPSSRWDRAKRAADLFVAGLKLVSDGSFDDRIGIAQFSWDCDRELENDYTGAVFDLETKLSFGLIPPAPRNTPTDPIESYTERNTGQPPTTNCTPIQRALEYIINGYGCNCGDAANLERDRVAVLLSDGVHNAPDSTQPVDLNGFGNAKRLVQIRTVAIGPDEHVDTDLLDDIAAEFRGGDPNFVARYANAITSSGLVRAYVETLEEPFQLNFIEEVGGTYTPGMPDKLIFLALWDNPTDASNLRVQRTGHPEVTGNLFHEGLGYAAVVVNGSANTIGDWTVLGATGGPVPTETFVLADLRISARFFLERSTSLNGDEQIILYTVLKDRGRPLNNSTVTVTVDIDKPTLGLGHFLTEIRDGCVSHRPPGPSLANLTIRSNATQPGTPARQEQDAPAGRQGLFQHHVNRCDTIGIDVLDSDSLLPRANFPRQPMADDGGAMDFAPQDGVYTLPVDATIEGTYNFTFHVSGETDGIRFTRTRRLSKFVPIVPRSENRNTECTILRDNRTGAPPTAHIFLLPWNAHRKRYLGPGFAHLFSVEANGAQHVGGMVDEGNGYYRQTLGYTSLPQLPEITVTIPGTSFTVRSTQCDVR